MTPIGALLLLALLGDPTGAAKAPAKKAPSAPELLRLPGEFETQKGLLVAVSELQASFPGLLDQLIGVLPPSLPLIALVRSEEEAERLREGLAEQGGTWAASVRCIVADHETLWVRDYGPHLVLDGKGGLLLADCEYASHRRPFDDAVPEALAVGTAGRRLSVPLLLDGGNLVSNGRGVVVSTRLLLDLNAEEGREEDEVRRVLYRSFGAHNAIFLEPLSGEPTGHVDVFACFVNETTILVGEMSGDEDSVNAEILDRNAKRLSIVALSSGGTLRVERIPMPTPEDDVWRSYTNVIFANGTLLVPSYPDADEKTEARALDVYARLLPGWTVIPLDVSDLIREGGALRCISMNVPAELR